MHADQMKQTISLLSLKRVCHRAGIKRISADSYKPIYQLMITILADLAEKIKTLANTKKVIDAQDVENGQIVALLLKLSEKDHTDARIQTGGSPTDYPGFCDGANSQCQNTFAPGHVAVSAIEDSCAGGPGPMQGGGSQHKDDEHYFTIPLKQFERFVAQHLPREYTFHLNGGGLDQLQYHIENEMIQQLSQRNMILERQNIKQFFLER